MTHRKTKKHKPLPLQFSELAFTAPQVISHRMFRLATAGLKPSRRDQQEMIRMNTEKYQAMSESINSILLESIRMNQELTFSCLRMFWLSGTNPVTAAFENAIQMGKVMNEITSLGIAPFHRRAMANAKRLYGSGRKSSK